MRNWVAVYDIGNDRRRLRLANVLEDYGDRVQYSVFELTLEEASLDAVLERVRRVIDPAQDLVRLYPLCAACATKVVEAGAAKRPPFDTPRVIIV